jgi:TonB family protein
MRRSFPIILLVLILSFAVAGQDASSNDKEKATPVKITKIVQPVCPPEAKAAGFKGNVRLQVEFLANGKIGKITYAKPSSVNVLKEDPFEKYGLVKNAIEAAKKLEFEPATRDGEPITVVKVVEYVFNA